MKYLRATIRIVAFFALSGAVYGCWFLGSFIVPNKQYWRQIAFTIWANGFVRLAGMSVEVIGETPKPPFFLVSNHLSYMDIPVLRSLVDSIFVAKGEIRGWLFAGKIVSDMGMVFIDRQNRRDIPRAGVEIIKKLESGEGVIVFPEGTSTNGEEILPFNSSFFEFAAQTGLPIHYAAITYRVDEPGTKASDAVCWWDDSTFVGHMWKFFQTQRSKAIVTFGSEPVASSDRKELARSLWSKVNEKFIPVV
ncbi:MAG: 1-acyl-sn-glycerol-3-phosphate acyltransferase [Acidobacteria bacterium]|nr:MAG: 1-acyl-sn-glycerol-3-phosphate acyltransferase [Acidobacteriota bacterium]REJ98834.1 MAG: 1-acyl-sn-glycerol-3-phosphate acyltransferase [Acidobacteriota bacterium]REK16446.1 MAG: 1-acyl-sn-glycerol-3-phosphate acyltransferase [Acidobacteriota bacterium]REK44127.1 MAG: 1-acyl-sn-glycerol-3-phosphate acyltransferase [Acidobacteriota bacterium]